MNTYITRAKTNTVKITFLRVNFSVTVLKNFRRCSHKNFSILDLKALYRRLKCGDEIMKLLPEKPEPFLLNRILNQIAKIRAIHSVSLVDISAD